MEKLKPKIFVNKIGKLINNCQKIYYSKVATNSIKTDSLHKESNNSKIDKFIRMNINQKISSLMNLPKYLYDIDLVIVTEDDVIETKIIGKNNNNLITVNNTLIPVKDILDISIKK